MCIRYNLIINACTHTSKRERERGDGNRGGSGGGVDNRGGGSVELERRSERIRENRERTWGKNERRERREKREAKNRKYVVWEGREKNIFTFLFFTCKIEGNY